MCKPKRCVNLSAPKAVKSRSLPFCHEIFSYFRNEEAAIQFCFDKGIFNVPDNCPKCGEGSMKYREGRKTFQCSKKHCRKEISICKGTFFEMSKVSIDLILKLAYFWLSEANWTRIQTYLPISGVGVTDFFGYFRQLTIDNINTAEELIGGPGIVVEIDESKFAKRKYHRGKKCGDGSWIFGGVERTDSRRFFAVPVMKRDAETLLPIIQAFIHPQSIIMSDKWSAYNNISKLEEGYDHQTVNHSKNFVDPLTGACTNRIECKWSKLKQKIPKRRYSYEKVGDEILVQVWRHQNKDNLWNAFIEALKVTVYVE